MLLGTGGVGRQAASWGNQSKFSSRQAMVGMQETDKLVRTKVKRATAKPNMATARPNTVRNCGFQNL